MTLTVLNDVHIGAIRSTGTTPQSQIALRQHLITSFKALLPDTDLMILGDLFDKENIPISDVLATYETLADWLKEKSQRLYLVAGNHDLSKSSATMSSFDFLCKLLTGLYPQQVVAIHAPTMTPYGYVIPHLANQDLFNLALEGVPACSNLFLHCNYDNNFAVQSDHSLNLSREQADKAPVTNIIIAHEHHQRRCGKVTIPGNQIASSVSDWLSAWPTKHYVVVEGDVVQWRCAAERDAQLLELDWQSITESHKHFIRITGTASADQASTAVSRISRLRQASRALVIVNAVTIVSEDTMEEFAQALEEARGFSVWDRLKTLLTEVEVAKLESLL